MSAPTPPYDPAAHQDPAVPQNPVPPAYPAPSQYPAAQEPAAPQYPAPPQYPSAQPSSAPPAPGYSVPPAYAPQPGYPAQSGGIASPVGAVKLPPFLANISDPNLLWGQVGGAALTILGIFLPWYTVSANIPILGSYSESVNGFDDGAWGWLLLLLGLAAGGLAFIKVRNISVPQLRSLPPFLPFVLTGISFLFGLIRWIYYLSDGGHGGEVKSLEAFGVHAGTGAGIWFVLLGTLVAFAGTLIPVLKTGRIS